ncbi:serine hydrolase [Solicola sp. PLA-1-18]|uniref:serine hydrolase n=1 Tax=Solicola sp. PLA-1-18 TaxID=3380532 RepID=UPI003B81A6B0
MSRPVEVVGHDAAAMAVAHDVAARWEDAGLGGALLARNVDTGEELGFDVGRSMPLASLVKLPLALVVLDAVDRGLLRDGQPVELDPGARTPGSTGLGAFSHPCTVALGDLVGLAVTLSDNAAADALFDLVPPGEVSAALDRWGLPDVRVRHRMADLHAAADAVADDSLMALELAVRATTEGGGHVISMLDVARANCGTARAVADLVQRVWTDEVATPTACARLRALMGRQLTSRRMAVELASDTVTVSSKTGTFLNVRHEAAMVETALGDRVVVVALTESSVPAMVSPETDLAIGHAGRAALRALRT